MECDLFNRFLWVLISILNGLSVTFWMYQVSLFFYTPYDNDSKHLSKQKQEERKNSAHTKYQSTKESNKA